MSIRFNHVWRPKDTQRVFDNLKNKQISVWSDFFIWKSLYILKVYSFTLHKDMKYKTYKNFLMAKSTFKKCTFFFFCNFSFILNLRFLDELKDKICVSKSWFNRSFNWTSIKRYSEWQCKVTYNFAKKDRSEYT